MAGAVHIPWYATGFRGDQLEEAVAEFAAVALNYGATSYSVHRARDDRHKILQTVEFERKGDWERYWNGPEAIRFRSVCSGWYQVLVVYAWHDVIVKGELKADDADVPADAAA